MALLSALFVFVLTCAHPILSVALVFLDPSRVASLPSFSSFQATHDRSYILGTAEYSFREKIYMHNLEKIKQHNNQPSRKWTAGVNHLADHTEEEFASLLGWHHLSSSRRPGVGKSSVFELEALPENVSWTHLAMASHIPTQGMCGSCWAMAAATTLSAHSEINFGKPTHFSVQELVDCVQNPLNCGGMGGCFGATVELAMDWALYNGLEALHEVPKSMGAEGQCKKPPFRSRAGEQGILDSDGRLVSSSMPKPANRMTLVEANSRHSINLANYATLPSNRYKPLLRAVLAGPVAVSVDAQKWDLYGHGIFDDCQGSEATINHAVVLFGYGRQHDTLYWLVRNSWGKQWGEHGFIRVLRTDDEESICMTDNKPKQGVSCDGAPASVQVCGHCGILYDAVIPHFVRGKPETFYQSPQTSPEDGQRVSQPNDGQFDSVGTD